MNNFIKFTDAASCTISLPENQTYHKTFDAKSKSGHTLVTQIDMTHSGIVTENYGFYMPDSMRKGVPSFTDQYNKPVIVGHDDDGDPVGRVIGANYVDSANMLRTTDKYLNSMMNFIDKKGSKKFQVHDFAQHVVQEYWGKKNYEGLGHIRGTLEITDEATIQKILDKRFLTVSTAMVSDSARCSECGVDWISEGPCEHERGKTYDSGVPVMLIPGSQKYRHLGIVTEPADPFAAGFSTIEIMKDGVSKELEKINQIDFDDKFSIAANLFSYQDNKLFSLSDENKTNLIEVKNDIQEIQDSLNRMENVKMKKYTDQIEATISLWANDEEGQSTSVRVSKYVKELDDAALSELSKKALALLDSTEFKSEADFKDALTEFIEKESEVKVVIEDDAAGTKEEPVTMKKVKILDARFRMVNGSEYEAELENKALTEITELKDADLNSKDMKELSKLVVRSRHEDALASLTLNAKEKELTDVISEFKELKDKRFKVVELSELEVLAKMNDFLAEDMKISEEAFEAMDAKSCAGTGKYFPVATKEMAGAARKVLGLSLGADSLRGKILGNIEKLASKVEDSSEKASESFDTSSDRCNNQEELTDEKLLADLKSLVLVADERGLLTEVVKPFLAEKTQEIEILEEQLDAANDEVDSLEGQLKSFQDEAKKDLAIQVVDAKIKSGLFSIEDREKEITSHIARSDDSLKDMAKDFATIEDKSTEETHTGDLQKIETPVIQDSSESSNEQSGEKENNVTFKDKAKIKKDKVSKKYNQLKASKGKRFADSWLRQQNL
jgi:hypothetical protein